MKEVIHMTHGMFVRLYHSYSLVLIRREVLATFRHNLINGIG